MSKTFKVTMKTPDKTFFDGEASYLELQSSEGRYGILAHHAPTVIYVNEGIGRFTENGEEKKFYTNGGVAEIKKGGDVLLLCAVIEYEKDVADALNKRKAIAESAKQRMKESYYEYKKTEVSLAMEMKNLSGKADKEIKTY